MINYKNNPVYNDIKKYKTYTVLELYQQQQRKIKIKQTNKIGNWFLECKYNPKYKYCRDRLEKEHYNLYAN